ncbi:unnamed protein product, partial [Diamesa serratosioi]
IVCQFLASFFLRIIRYIILNIYIVLSSNNHIVKNKRSRFKLYIAFYHHLLPPPSTTTAS